MSLDSQSEWRKTALPGGQVGDLMSADGGLAQNGGCRGGEKDRGPGCSLC